MQLCMLQDDICEGSRAGALQSVKILVPGELRIYAACNVVADVPQRWMPGRSCKHPLEHLHRCHQSLVKEELIS